MLWKSLTRIGVGAASAMALTASCSSSPGNNYLYLPGDDGSTPPQDAAPPDVIIPISDGSSCGPGSLANFTPTWAPPVQMPGACSDAQLTNLIASCFDMAATQAQCDAWLQDPNNKTCFHCWAGPVTATSWAPYVYALNQGETDYINLGGCVELTDPSQDACAKTLQAAFTCEMAACLANCPVPSGTIPDGGDATVDAGTVDPTVRTAAIMALNSCYDQADVGGCKTFADAAATCSNPLMEGGSGAAFCFQAATDNNALKQLFTLACGGTASDAGAGDSGGSDSGADSSEDGGGGG
jgi:hypothetical protein